MNIGYACLTVDVPNTNFRNCIMKNASESTLLDIISHNLNSLDQVLDYNFNQDIRLFRISSDIIPFGSSPVNMLKWWEIFEDRLTMLGKKIAEQDIRVSMHPGQYTVLNSPHSEVADKAVMDLEYHCKVLDSLHLQKKHKIILHIGGIYGDKEQASTRFIGSYHKLNDRIKDRLVIENDDRLYNISDVLKISGDIQAPVIFDNLHHKINPCAGDKDEFDWIEECKKTWKKEDGVQKIHYSQQHPLKKPGSHSDTIETEEFLFFYHNLNRQDIDIMLEVKDKNLSAIKCINLIRNNHE